MVEDNELESRSITELLLHDDIEIINAGTGAAALEALRSLVVRLLRAGSPVA